MRARFERFGRVSRAKLQRKFPRLRFQDHTIGELPMESVCAVETPARVVLYLHGGAFFMGSPASYRSRAMRLSYRCHAEVFVPAYRLAPEHPFPAALDDALAAWKLVHALRRDAPLFVAGDSAGGGLSLSLLVRLRDLGLRMPNGAVLLSPWTDLTVSGASVERNHGKDLWFTRKHLEVWARYYVDVADGRSPSISPVFADLSGLPPLLLLVGENELLLDDARRVGNAANEKGTSACVLIGKGMQHDWPLTLPWLDESRHAWSAIQAFIEEHSPCGPGGGHGPQNPSPTGAKYVPATQSPFGVEVWDCRAFTHYMLSTTADAEVARKFGRLRASGGEEYKDRRPRDARTVSCNLTYHCRQHLSDGPLFKSEEMEDKWDIYLFDGVIHFARSWTGELVFCANGHFHDDQIQLSSVVVAGGQDSEFALRVVDYLVKSHILGRAEPHPLPAELPKAAYPIAAYSFSTFGRRCSFGTYADTKTIQAPNTR